MTEEKAIDLLDNLIGMVEDNHNSDYDTALKMGIKALVQEPTTKNDLGVDCISRVEVIDYLCKHCPDDGECFKDCDEIKHLRQMPSVTPQEPKTGHWIVEKGSYLGKRTACCDNCKDFYTHNWNVMNYCPNCGAKMESEEK